jgi:uncharacterized protein
MHERARFLIDTLGMRQHPEGGYYAEIYRSRLAVRRSRPVALRTALTAIYSLFPAGAVSRWHRVSSDELWSHLEGDPLELFTWDPATGKLASQRLGPVGADARPLLAVAAGVWQAARPLGGYALVSCAVGPGFEFADFEIAGDHPESAALLRQHVGSWADLL